MTDTKSGRRASNPRHSLWKSDALPAELHPHLPRKAAPKGPIGIAMWTVSGTSHAYRCRRDTLAGSDTGRPASG